MKEKPTTYQLAQLASMAAPPIKVKDAVKRAWEIWREAEIEIAEHDERIDFLHRLFWTPNGQNVPIFTDSPKDWQARIQSYTGDQCDVERAMWNQEFPAERVEKKLYSDNNIKVENKHSFTLALAKVCIINDLEGPLVSGQGHLDYIASVNGHFIDSIPGFPIHPIYLKNAENYFETVSKSRGNKLMSKKEWDFVNIIQNLLSQPKLNAHLVRWAVEVRQKQISLSEPNKVKLNDFSKKSNQSDSIQVKKPYRQ